MKSQKVYRSTVILLILLMTGLSSAFDVKAQIQTDIAGPAGSELFGTQVLTLANGNFVVTDYFYDEGALSNVGAVYLYNGVTKELISTLKGNLAGNRVGLDGVVGLPNSNFLVLSPEWDGNGASNAGAITFCNGVTGCDGIVNTTNSLVGAVTDDLFNSRIRILPNGKYIVNAQFWNNGAIANAGMAMLCDGTVGCTGQILPTNALVGSTANDEVGEQITLLPNGNYVVHSDGWQNTGADNAGAVTVCDSTTGCAGMVVSPANSLVGSTTGDSVGGSANMTILSNGNFVIRSPVWDNAAITNAGAVTLCSGTSGCPGAVSPAMSRVGSTATDNLGNLGSIFPLTNGNFVIRAPNWDNGATVDVGAVSFCGATCTGAVSASNSLIGSTANDQVGNISTPGPIALPNGNYVVGSGAWDNGAATNAGAVTLCNGTTGCSGPVTTANSLVGSTSVDVVGGSNIIALPNSNFVVPSRLWNNGATADVGAVTFCDAATGCAGQQVSAANSLIGTAANDLVGGGQVYALSNGKYVVASPGWATNNIGAVTLCSGTTGCIGMSPSAANSLVGSTASDSVGNIVDPLPNGNYVVRSPSWDRGGIADAGAVTFCSGNTGCTGTISLANSLVGSTLNDLVGSAATGVAAVTALSNSKYIVNSSEWNNGAAADAGAVTLCNGATGCVGAVSATNSLVGSTSGDRIGTINLGMFSSTGINVFPDGTYFVFSADWDNGAVVDAGAVSFGDATDGVVGTINSTNSVRGTFTGGGSELDFVFDPINNQMIVGRPQDNIVTVFQPDGTATPTNTPTATPTVSGTPGCTPTERIGDGTFEAGDPWPLWTVQTSTNFGSANCSISICGTDSGAGPLSGNNWVWFGGISSPETATLGQNVTIPAGSATLTFQMRIGTVTAPFTDTLTVKIDGTTIATFTEPSAAEGGYTLRSVDVSAFANGGSHAILFTYTGPTNGEASFNVDNVSLAGGVCSTPTATNTPTLTPTNTATPTATPTSAGTPSISGVVTYDNAIGAPAPPVVSNVTITGTGSPNVVTTTAAPGATAGQYTLTGFGAGSYTVTPTKTGGSNSITSFDAARISQHVAGPPNPQLTSTQLLVADVSGNTSVTSFDAAMIAKFAAGPPYVAPGIGSTSTWRFTPVNRIYASVAGTLIGEDFSALLMGEVSGNWNNTGARSFGRRPEMEDKRQEADDSRQLAVAVGSHTVSEKDIFVPVNVHGIADKGVISYEFDLRYDPSVIQPQVNAVEVKDTVSHGLVVVTNATEPGLVRVVVYGAYPIDSDGVLLHLRFTAVCGTGSVSPILFERIMFNEGEWRVAVTDGKVELL